MAFWSRISFHPLSKKEADSFTIKINSKCIASSKKLNQALQKRLGKGQFEIEVRIIPSHCLRLTNRCLPVFRCDTIPISSQPTSVSTRSDP